MDTTTRFDDDNLKTYLKERKHDFQGVMKFNDMKPRTDHPELPPEFNPKRAAFGAIIIAIALYSYLGFSGFISSPLNYKRSIDKS